MAKSSLRVYIPSELDKRFRAVIALRSDEDLTISDAVAEAIETWLAKSPNRELVEEHRLDRSGERRKAGS